MSVTFSAARADGGNRFQSWVEVGDLNLCNANAAALLRLLRLYNDDHCGSVSIADARRAIMVARATFESVAPSLRRPGFDGRAPATVVEINGVTTIAPGARWIQQELTEDDLAVRLDRFAELVEAAAAAGADIISWG